MQRKRRKENEPGRKNQGKGKYKGKRNIKMYLFYVELCQLQATEVNSCKKF